MPKPTLKRVEELFHSALAHAPAERAAYLDAACAGDKELRAAVEELLRHDEAPTVGDGFLTSPVKSQAEAYRPDSPTLPAPPTDTPSEFPVIPGFEVLGNLGRGGMGIVYKARQNRLNRIVAIKMLLPFGVDAPDQMARFRSEVEILARLRHPNIVPIYDVGEVEGRPYFVMEFIDGPSLGHFLGGRPQDPRASARLIETLARTIQVVHDSGVIHRDLKPANVLLEASGTKLELGSAIPRITDFGLAKDPTEPHDLTLAGTTVGTPCYMAPEQARTGSKSLRPTADIYSLGAILYEMLTGRPPFSANTPEETIVRLLNDEPLSPSRLESSLPRDLVTICLKCLEKWPDKRYASATDLAEDLRRFQAHEPIRARPVGPIEHAWRWCRRRPLVAALAALCALLVVSLFVTVLVFNERLRAQAEQQRQQIVQLNIHIGLVSADAGDTYAALLRFAEALRMDEGRSAEQTHRARIAELLRNIPSLIQHRLSDQSIAAVGICDSRVVLVTNRDNRVLSIADALTGEQKGRQIEIDSAPRQVALSDCGRWVAIVGSDDTIRIWNRQNGGSTTLTKRAGASISRLSFHPDSAMLAVHYENAPPAFWDISADAPTEKPALTGSDMLTAVSHNGRWMIRIEGNTTGRVVDTNNAAGGSSFGVRPDSKLGAISSDGKHVALADAKRALALFDASSDGWKETPVKLPDGLDELIDEQFSPDGLRLLICDRAGRVCICDTTTGRVVTPMMRNVGPLAAARFVGDRQLVTVAKSGLIRVWEMPADSSKPPPTDRSVSDLVALAQILAGGRINSMQQFEGISQSELQDSWNKRSGK